MVLHYLLEHHAEAHGENIFGDTPLHLACYNANEEVVKQLISLTGPDSLVKENLFGEKPLHSACTNGWSLELIKFLLEQPVVNINCQGKDGHTALHSACDHGHIRIVQFLLEWRADMNLVAQIVDQKDGNEKIEEQTALMWANEQGCADLWHGRADIVIEGDNSSMREIVKIITEYVEEYDDEPVSKRSKMMDEDNLEDVKPETEIWQKQALDHSYFDSSVKLLLFQRIFKWQRQALDHHYFDSAVKLLFQRSEMG
ncbi:TNNI3K [Mytilus coruscus]|uniref:TNNI3K n=1 Tax=Mytilus coruscus TaxID=42192 RepID=A0A6J8EDQ8_MYTCO|nr:TNNI3K [Mytilus coruscus]